MAILPPHVSRTANARGSVAGVTASLSCARRRLTACPSRAAEQRRWKATINSSPKGIRSHYGVRQESSRPPSALPYTPSQSGPDEACAGRLNMPVGVVFAAFSDISEGMEIAMSTGTPEQVLRSIVDGINTGNLDALMALYEPDAGFAGQPGSLAHGLTGVRQGLAGFIAMKGTLDLKVTRVLQASDLALVVGVWSFTGTGPDGGPVKLTGHNADVLRRQADGQWRFVIDNPWGTE